jgi:type II restriction/modification system DNA methylase subunit YeeA
MVTTAERLHTFVNFVSEHLTGDEKGEAQTFLDRFFRAFGHGGAIEAGATYEERIHKGSKKGKTGFADLVWKPRVLIEMKKRGADLSKHYSQAFDYWQRAVPNRPRYVMLCNFDEFWVYDFDTQIDTPIDTVPLAQLPERVATFGFMEVTERKSVFGNNQVEVTEKAAGRMGELYQMLSARLRQQGQYDQPDLVAQRFVLQSVLAMFAEDRGLLPRSLFVQSVQDCLGGDSAYDVLGGLFREMNTPGTTPAGRFKGVDYFNGGLFQQIDPIDLTPQELKFLEVSALEDWSKVRPAIFGNIFESAIDQQDRHAHGIHYTAEADIMKIVRPTISRYWEERIDQANTIGQLEALQLELQTYRVLDPACGSGNFLYIAYQELKQIEQDLLDKIAERRRSPREQIQMGFVTPLQFFGIDNNPFAVELARVTLMIARKVAVDRLGLTEATLPLDTLDQNIRCQDALFTEWPKADAIIGNPPFLGGKHMRLELGDQYVDRINKSFVDVKDSVDLCTYWFRKSHQSTDDSGRIGLVGTNSVSQGRSREASLEFISKNGGFIHEAISTQVWSGEAKVHVSIVNWSKETPKILYLDNKKVDLITSSLSAATYVLEARKIKANSGKCFQGVIPAGKDFIVSEEIVFQWAKQDSRNEEILKPYSMGSNLARNPNGRTDRWIIDFNDMSIENASKYEDVFKHVKSLVKPIRDKNRDSRAREYWWRFLRPRPEMRETVAPLDSYFAVPRVSKWFIFLSIPSIWLPGDLNVVMASDDFYILGILTSQVHRAWVQAQSSTLKGDTRYTHNTCFETFPFPQNPTPATAFPSPVRYDFGSKITVYQGSQGLCCTSRKREPLYRPSHPRQSPATPSLSQRTDGAKTVGHHQALQRLLRRAS